MQGTGWKEKAIVYQTGKKGKEPEYYADSHLPTDCVQRKWSRNVMETILEKWWRPWKATQTPFIVGWVGRGVWRKLRFACLELRYRCDDAKICIRISFCVSSQGLGKIVGKMLGETSVFVSPRSIFNRLQLQKDHCPLPSYQKCPSSKKPTDLLSCYRSRCFMDVSPFVGGVAQRPWDVFFWVVGSMAASFPLMDDWKNQSCDGNMVPEPETYCGVKGW